MPEHTNLKEAFEDLKQRAWAALDWYDNELDIRDGVISARETEITIMSVTIAKQKDDLEACQETLEINKLTIQRLEAEIESLKTPSKPVDPPSPPVPPIPPVVPIEVSPDTTVILQGLGSFRPGIKGDRQGNEIRYRGTLNNEVDIIIDCKDDGQVAVSFERCWSDLPTTAPALQSSLHIKLGSEDYVQPLFRLHHHTRPRKVFNPSKPPKVDLQSLISSALIPNYDRSITIPEEDLKRVAEGRFPYERWSNKFQTDPISEQYGQVVNSWTGGAGAWGNEASHLTPVQVMYLFSQDPRAWNEVAALANSSGNYPIHYKLRDDKGGRFPQASETGPLPFLQGALPVTLKSASGITLSVPEPAHEHNLVSLAYYLTGERWYREELEAWHVYNVLTRPKNDLRLKGIVWSGQVRAAAWSLRALLHAFMAHAGSAQASQFVINLLNNFAWMRDTFTLPSSPEYRTTGVTSLQPFRAAPLLKFVTMNPKPSYFSTWNLHILASVLNECVRAGFPESIPMRDHVLNVVKGQWQHGLSPYHIGWGNHAFIEDNWREIIRVTFEGRTADDPPAFSFPTITTPDYVAWARSAVVAAVDAKQSWANDALKWIDTEAPKYKGGVPLPWRINPTKENTR